MSLNKITPHLSEIDEISNEVYDELVTSLCIEVAYGVHRMAKNGTMKLSDIMIPRNGRDSLSTAETAKENKKRGSLDKISSTKRQRRTTLDSENGEQELSQQHALETAKSTPSLRTSPTPMVTRNASNNSLVDVWGRILPKEPKKTVKCLHCGKGLSALRFAMHLDKCLIGNTRTTK
mmetsp:Transcript_21963/g.26110  ORF Transcript_21963/g.26110 Transcript_21963/m.26110 type:complete len:177 (+) Transcript_21963:106-636(+)